jgi:hypothetical protein
VVLEIIADIAKEYADNGSEYIRRGGYSLGAYSAVAEVFNYG